jgi:dipeptidyl aminopeptidase/acylaminoacyl peptidase
VGRFLLVAIVALALPASASADALIYRCGTNVCRAAPDGSARKRLTHDGGTYTWVSASADGSRLAVVRSTFARVLDARGHALTGDLPRGGTVVIAEIAPDRSQVATIELLPEITPAPVGSPPGSPGISGLNPYLFVMDPDGGNRDVSARSIVDTGWRGNRLTRTDSGDASPFPLGICQLATNTGFQCDRDLARDATRDLFNPAFSPDGSRVAVVQSQSSELGRGPIVVYDTATAAPVRTLTAGADAHPSWSPDGKRIAFVRGSDVYVVSASGGKARRVPRGGGQPVWTAAAACRSKPRLKARGHTVTVTACAPRPGRLTVTLRRNGKAVAHKTVRVPTGRLVKVRFSRPAGKLSVRTHFSG